MFTGIIETIGNVISVKPGILTVSAGFSAVQAGESISVNGVCLTVRSFSSLSKGLTGLCFDASPETVSRTNLKNLKTGAKVNLERAVKADGTLFQILGNPSKNAGNLKGYIPLSATKPSPLSPEWREGRLGGHIMTGHVEATGLYLGARKRGNSLVMDFSAPAGLMRHVVAKGSIGVEGISLTVMEKKGKGFTSAIIPHTFENTNLKFKRNGDKVNLEPDILAKYAENLAGPVKKSGLTREFLKEHGF